MMEFVIAMDSSGELTEAMKADEHFYSVPLTLEVGDWSGLDDETFDQADFLRRVREYPEAPKSACPSPDYFRKCFMKGAKRAYGVTLTAALSGSYNSALLGRELALDENPDLQIHVFNSCSASVGETLIGQMIWDLEKQGLPFEEIVEKVEDYISKQNTMFVLDSLEALRKNGRLSNMKAFVATAFKIKPVLGATPNGQIEQIAQTRGLNKALAKLAELVAKSCVNPEERILGISNCNNREKAEEVRRMILERVQVKDVIFLDMHGISSLYAAEGGIIVAL